MEQPVKVKLMRTLYITDILNYNIHLGTHVKKTNAKMRPFIMGKYHEYAIINIFKTYVHLLRIKLFLTKIIINTGNSNVLFISTDRLLAPVIEQLATMCMSSYINDVCKGGILTNFKFVSKRKKKKSTSWQPSFAESKNQLNKKKKTKHALYESKQEKEKIFKALQPASSFKLPGIKKKIILNKLYKISHLSDTSPDNKYSNLQYVNTLRIFEKTKKITIKKNPVTGSGNSSEASLPKIKRKIVLKKFYKISDPNQTQSKISRSPAAVLDKVFDRNKLNDSQLTNQTKQSASGYLLKVIGKKIYKIYRPKRVKTKISGVNPATNIPSTNLLNIPTKKRNFSISANSSLNHKSIKSFCRKPRLKRISSSKLSKVFIKDIYKVYYLEPMKIKIFDKINQTEIKTFDVNKIENKNFRLPAVTTNIIKNGVESTNEASLLKNKNISRPTNKIAKREFYSFLDKDIQEFFYPDSSPVTIEQYQKERKRENQTKKIFNNQKKINCQFEEKKYEYIQTGLLNFPQIVIIVGQQKEMKIIKECQKLNILTISISDSDGDPSLTNLFIPGNDDHPISVEYMLKHLAEATEIGKIILNSQGAASSDQEKEKKKDEEKKKKLKFSNKK